MRTIKRLRERRRRELLRFLFYPQKITLGAEPIRGTPLDALIGGVWALPDDYELQFDPLPGHLHDLRGL